MVVTRTGGMITAGLGDMGTTSIMSIIITGITGVLDMLPVGLMSVIMAGILITGVTGIRMSRQDQGCKLCFLPLFCHGCFSVSEGQIAGSLLRPYWSKRLSVWTRADTLEQAPRRAS